MKWRLTRANSKQKPNLSQFEFQTSYYISSSIVILAFQTYQISDKVEKTQWDVSLIMKERAQFCYIRNTNIILLLGKILEFDFYNISSFCESSRWAGKCCQFLKQRISPSFKFEGTIGCWYWCRSLIRRQHMWISVQQMCV